MTLQDMAFALGGGALIGLSASLMLMLNGRIAGISGIVGGLLQPQAGRSAGGLGSWRDCSPAVRRCSRCGPSSSRRRPCRVPWWSAPACSSASARASAAAVRAAWRLRHQPHVEALARGYVHVHPERCHRRVRRTARLLAGVSS